MNERKHKAVTYGVCVLCGEPYQKGTWIVHVSLAKFEHLECPVSVGRLAPDVEAANEDWFGPESEAWERT